MIPSEKIRKVVLVVVSAFPSMAIPLGMTITGCALTVTRPVQEMSNAGAAIRAAKDVNADSITPEIFRAASENYFKAKREYRMKNFEQAKRYAVKAMKLAEQAEFDSFRMGGATPELQNSIAPEGASTDTEAAFGSINENLSEPTLEPTLPPEKEPDATEITAEEEQGTEYNEYLRQLEEEKLRLEKERLQAEAEKARADAERAKNELETEKLKNAPPSNPQLQLIQSNEQATF